MYKYFNKTVAAAAPSAAMEAVNYLKTAQLLAFATNGTKYHQCLMYILVSIREICGKICKNNTKIKNFFVEMKKALSLQLIS